MARRCESHSRSDDSNVQANPHVLHLHVLRRCSLSTPGYGAQLGFSIYVPYASVPRYTSCMNLSYTEKHSFWRWQALLILMICFINVVYNSYYKDLEKVLMAFSGASASYSQNKPGSQCEVAVTCQSLCKVPLSL